jgi:germination protein M
VTEHARKDGRLWPWIVTGAGLAVALSVGAYLFFQETKRPAPQVSAAFKPATTIPGKRIAVKLYFPSRDGRSLIPETREVRELPAGPEQLKEVVGELIRGPVGGELAPSFPAEARVKSIFVEEPTGTAYINFSRELQTEYPGGAWTETLTIYSLVNTLTQDFPDIKQVQILVEGEVIDSLAGHIDASRPFPPRLALDKE